MFLGKSQTGTGTAEFGPVQTGFQSVWDRTSPTLDWRPSDPVFLEKSQTQTGPAGFGPVQTRSQSVWDPTSPTLGSIHNVQAFGFDVYCMRAWCQSLWFSGLHPMCWGVQRDHAPVLPRLNLEPSSVEFLERLPNGLHEGAPSGLFRVNITNMGERILKV